MGNCYETNICQDIIVGAARLKASKALCFLSSAGRMTTLRLRKREKIVSRNFHGSGHFDI